LKKNEHDKNKVKTMNHVLDTYHNKIHLFCNM